MNPFGMLTWKWLARRAMGFPSRPWSGRRGQTNSPAFPLEGGWGVGGGWSAGCGGAVNSNTETHYHSYITQFTDVTVHLDAQHIKNDLILKNDNAKFKNFKCSHSMYLSLTISPPPTHTPPPSLETQLLQILSFDYLIN